MIIDVATKYPSPDFTLHRSPSNTHWVLILGHYDTFIVLDETELEHLETAIAQAREDHSRKSNHAVP